MASSSCFQMKIEVLPQTAPLLPPPPTDTFLWHLSSRPTPQPNPTNPQKDRKKEKKLFPLKFRRPSSLPQNGRERDHKQREEDGRTDFFFFLLISSLISPRQYEIHPSMKSYMVLKKFSQLFKPLCIFDWTKCNIGESRPKSASVWKRAFLGGIDRWGKRGGGRGIYTHFSFPPRLLNNDCGFLKEKKEIGMSWFDPFSSFTCPFLGWGGKRSVCAMGFFGATIFPLLKPQRGGWLKFIFREKREHPLLAHITFSNF